jgi:hypothetical protein
MDGSNQKNKTMKKWFLAWIKEKMEKSNNKILYTIIFLLIMVGSFIGGRYSTLRIRNTLKYNIIAQRDSIRSYEIEIKGLKMLVFEKDALILSQQDAIDAGILENSTLKALHLKSLVANAKLEGTIKILRDSLAIQPGSEFITVKDSSMIKDYLRVPFTLIDLHTRDINLIAGMRANRQIYFNLEIPIKGQMYLGYVNDGLFKRKPVGVFTTTNRYLTINNAEITIVNDPPKVYQQWWFHSLTGIFVFEGFQLLYKKIK